MNDRVYIHELIDVIGHNRSKYMHHMTANWVPVARAERNQLCYGVWATVGSTGRWPEVVNMWELDGWDGLVADFAHELVGAGAQDESLAAWWAAAASLRRGGLDRIVVPAPWARPIDALVADGVRGAVYAHELVTVPPGVGPALLDAVAGAGRTAWSDAGAEPVGAFRVVMGADTEVVLLWALPDWPTWGRAERAWLDATEGSGPFAGWLGVLRDAGATWRRQLLVDAPLAPLRIGRQPDESDRRPLDEV